MTTTTNSFTSSGGAAYMSNRMDWETPTDLFASLDDEIADWVRKCSTEASRKNTLVVMPLPARTDTRQFQDYILSRAEARPPKGRLKFETDDVPDEPAPFPSMIVVIRTGER